MFCETASDATAAVQAADAAVEAAAAASVDASRAKRACLRPGWLKPSWVHGAALSIQPDGTTVITTAPIDKIDLLLWIRRHGYPDVTSRQYRTSLRRLCIHGGVGYRASELRADIRLILSQRIKELGRGSWGGSSISKTNYDPALDESIQRMIDEENTMEESAKFAACRSSTSATTIHIANVGAGYIASSWPTEARVNKPHRTDRKQPETTADDEVSNWSLYDTHSDVLDDKNFQEPAKNFEVCFMQTSSPHSCDNSVKTSPGCCCPTLCQKGECSDFDSADMAEYFKRSRTEGPTAAAVDVTRVEVSASSTTTTTTTLTSSELEAEISELSKCFIQVSVDPPSLDYGAWERHLTSCFDIPELVGFRVGHPNQQTPNKERLLMLYQNDMATEFLRVDTTVQFHQALSLEVVQTLRKTLQESNAKLGELVPVPKIWMNGFSQFNAPARMLVDAWIPIEKFSNGATCILFAPHNKVKLLRHPGVY